MCLLVLCGSFAFLTAGSGFAADEPDSRIFELRIYHAAPGKLEALLARFRNHTVKLFEKHRMTNVGYWAPLDNPDNKLIYILAFPSRKARDESFRAFLDDPEWQRVFKESEAEGTLVAKIESKFMTAADYSPKIAAAALGERIFELREYTASEGNLDRLNARFRNHTLKLFEKHGMTNIGYWGLAQGEKGAENSLIYLLAHKSVEAAKASFDEFRKDPDWIAARRQSEQEAGGSLTAKDGVKSTFLKATDFSPIR
jgi:hypothetical protein